MEIRDAVEDDAEELASLAGGPRDVLRNLIHDRTVRVAEDNGEIAGFVSFDARPGTVYVTQLSGDVAACERLLEEPVRFAEGEAMAVEVLVAEDDEAVREAVDGAGFECEGNGPRFDGISTVRYRLGP